MHFKAELWIIIDLPNYSWNTDNFDRFLIHTTNNMIYYDYSGSNKYVVVYILGEWKNQWIPIFKEYEFKKFLKDTYNEEIRWIAMFSDGIPKRTPKIIKQWTIYPKIQDKSPLYKAFVDDVKITRYQSKSVNDLYLYRSNDCGDEEIEY